MKKLFFVAVAAIAMTACSNEEVLVESTSQEIGFAAVNYNASRNAAADGIVFATTNKMIVSAVHTDAQKGAAKYFEGVTCAYDTDNWKSGYLWPLQGSMQFGAYSTDLALDADTEVAWGYDGNNAITGLNLDMTTTKLTGHEDLLYSDLKSGVDCKKVDGKNAPVPMNFRHALAWIYVKLNTNDDAANKVTVYDVRVDGVSLSGKAAITFDETKSTVAWSELTTAADTQLDASQAAMVINAEPKAWGNGLLLPKQNKTSITIEYTIMNGATETAHMTYTHELTATEEWVDANKYTYNVTISLNEITFTGSVTNFENQTAPTIEI